MQQRLSVLVIDEDRLPPVAECGDVVVGAWALDTMGANHANKPGLGEAKGKAPCMRACVHVRNRRDSKSQHYIALDLLPPANSRIGIRRAYYEAVTAYAMTWR